MTRAVAAPRPRLDPLTRRLLLLLPAAFPAHDHGELIGNDGRPPPSAQAELPPGAADSIGSKRPTASSFVGLTSRN
jgi:hypothetical protein